MFLRKEPQLRQEVINSIEIKKILLKQLRISFGSSLDYISGNQASYNTKFSEIVKNLGKLEQQPNDEIIIKNQIFKSIASLYAESEGKHVHSRFCNAAKIAEYVVLFYVDENNFPLENKQLPAEFDLTNDPQKKLSYFPTTDRLLKDLFTLYIQSNNNHDKDAVKSIIQQASTKNPYIQSLADKLMDILLAKNAIDINQWKNPVLNSSNQLSI